MNQWIERNHDYTLIDSASNFSINFAGMKFDETDLAELQDKFARAAREMKNLENGAIKNPDEQRKVTHFTDRIAYRGSALFQSVNEFAEALRSGTLTGATGRKFTAAVINGIGGSALGPQLMQFAINGPYWNELSDRQRNGYLKLYFLDNTDSAGLADLLQVMDPETTLQVTISKSGGTQETKNNLTALENYYAEKQLDFARHAAAITMAGSELDRHARGAGWLRVFEMAESIGGRTSETSIVGHLPAALAGVDFKAFLDGACHMDNWTRTGDYRRNPAYLLAAMWYIAGNGKGDRNMVIVPYADRLILMSRYLQQLVMESLGKELDLDGKVVHQGLNVFGNKGGTDAHAFIQQLNDGRDDFFITFIEVLKDAMRLPVGPDIVMGDYLHGFEGGLAAALLNKGRQVIGIQIDEINAFNLGMLIALYERAVAVYAEFIHINAFHQPGVQAYKVAAKDVLALREKLFAALPELGNFSGTAAEFAAKLGLPEREIEIGGLLAKAAVNCPCGCLTRSYDPLKGYLFTLQK
ncbi:glucose-6-phosphate isomerase [Victivallis sp. Marseille-Q1083]|uniref:glucose-6-phosphate isomerase n=1 Tax=Victivallis sp. Marseille-Q1083 TaxID=2717288 RepID=UPI00158B47DC|nr:glucose-6-phosphate isomerase [Victivallis sp. Marseille-Q1083]